MSRQIIVVLLFSVLTSLACKTKHQDVAVAFNGVVNFTIGTVQLADSAGKTGDLLPGAIVREGDRIITIGEKSLVDIYISDKALRIPGNSIVEISKLFHTEKKENQTIELVVEKGSIFSKIAKKLSKGDTYKIRTQTATASVRGTEFLVASLNGLTRVSCLTGKVVVTDNKVEESQVVLTNKEEARVESGKQIVKTQMSEDKLKQLQLLSNINELKEDIKLKYLQQKDEILKKYQDEKEKIKKAVDEQKKKDKLNLENQKLQDKQNIKKIKEQAGDAAEKAADEVSKSSDNIKELLKKQKDAAKKKPGIDQFKK